MADNLARKVEFNPSEQKVLQQRQRQVLNHQRQRQVLNHHNVAWTGFEKFLLAVGVMITIGLMTMLVSSSISATSAQHELTNVQRSVAKSQSQVGDLHQELGELTSSSRMNKIARSKGLALNEKNIRTLR